MSHKDFRFAVLAALLSSGLVQAADFTHVAREGDTLEGIARTYLKKPADWAGLQKLNKVEEPRRIPVGTKIRIPESWLRMDAAPARVGVVEGQVRRANEPLAAGGVVQPGDEITTGENGFATLELADGSRLVLQPKSQLRLDALQRSRGAAIYRTRLNLRSGRVDNEVARQPAGNAGYQVQTPAAVIAVRGTGFRVAAAEDASRTEVTEGVVAASRASRGATRRPVAVHAGEGLVVAPGGGDAGKPVPLLPGPDLGAWPARWEKVVLRLPVPVVPGAVAYRAQLSKDAEFRQVVAEGIFKASGQDDAAGVAGTTADSPHPQPLSRGGRGERSESLRDLRNTELKFPSVDDGRFWLRVRAVAADGLEGRDTVRDLTVKARPEPPFPSQPAKGGKVRGETVGFVWTAAQDAAGYLLRLTNAAGQPVLETSLLKDTAFQSGKLPPGDYQWRLASVRADGERGPFGDPVAFSLRPAPANPEPPAVDGDSLRFAWAGEPGQRFELEIAPDASFGAPLLRQTLAEPGVILPRPSSGTWFMRVRATDPDGFVGPWTATQRFEVPARPWWLLLLLAPVLM